MSGPLGARELAACAQNLAEALEQDRPDGLRVLAALPHLVYWKDAAGRYLGANPAYLAALGIGDTESLLAHRDDELPVRDALSATLPAIEAQVLADGVPVTGVQSLARGGAAGEGEAAGEQGRKVLLTVVPLRTADGQARGVLGVGADVTGLSELDAKVSYASRLESIGRLAANIAHQINTPVQFITDNVRFVADTVTQALTALQAIRDAVAVAQPGPVDPAVAAIGDVLEGADVDFMEAELPGALLQALEGLSQITQIVAGLSDFSRPDGVMAEADLNHAVDNAVHLTLADWKPVADLRLDLDPAAGKVLCYEGELRQVLLNLIGNAAQAITTRRDADPDGPPGLILVRTRWLDDQVQIVVEDNGCGMDPATRARIFDPFFTTRPLGQASGQGLSLAYTAVVTHHGGSLDVHTFPGQGSTFTVTLPTQPAQPTLAAAPGAKAGDAAGDTGGRTRA